MVVFKNDIEYAGDIAAATILGNIFLSHMISQSHPNFHCLRSALAPQLFQKQHEYCFALKHPAAIIVESTVVPFFSSRPLCCRNSTTCPNSCKLLLIRILRNLPRVSPSGTWLLQLRRNPRKSDCRYLGNGCLIRQTVQVLQQIQSQHQFNLVRLVSALSFVIARSGHGNPVAPRYDAFDLYQKFFFLVRTCTSSSLKSHKLICSMHL